MTVTQAVLIFATVALAGVGPFIAVKRGGDAYDFGDEPEPEPEPEPYERTDDDTTQIPRVTDEVDPYLY
jgi:hypothetical protein